MASHELDVTPQVGDVSPHPVREVQEVALVNHIDLVPGCPHVEQEHTDGHEPHDEDFPRS